MAGMNTPRRIDLATWPRREHFAHYRQAACSYSLTVELDATAAAAALARSRRKTYLAQVWALANAVNRHEEFRLTVTEDSAPAVWDVVHPSFTIFCSARETFASVWSPYDADFATFHAAAAEVAATHQQTTCLFPQGPPPANTFYVSALPWVSFTGFHLQVPPAAASLAPIFTLGRYRQSAGRTLLPLAIQVHHAAADGFHVSRLVSEVQELLAAPDWLE